MKKSLVIVESPSKAKTINKYLGERYKVIASVGHIKNLPKSKIGIDFENGYEPTYEVIAGKEKVIQDLKTYSKNAEQIFIATDPDREGEAIAFDIAQEIGKNNSNIKRILFNEITKSGVEEGLSNPLEIDDKLVDSQQARRVLDRIVGYQISPFLWKVIYYGLSAGRVQSVALRLICEREDEIRNFIPSEYWSIIADFKDTDKDKLFQAKLIKKNEVNFKFNGEDPKIGSDAEAEQIIKDLDSKSFKVIDISKKEVKRNPAPPFITSSLQQEASNKLRYPPKRTMILAQKLYEGQDIGGDEGTVGLITYMRTDSTTLSEQSINEARDFIKNQIGKEYVPHAPKHYTKKGKNTQDAHEAIRPTSVYRTPASLKGKISPELLKLYDLIWKRFLASQMESARYDQVTLLIETEDKENKPDSNVYQFRATSTTLKFPGYLKLYKESNGNGEDDEEFTIPEGIEIGDAVKCSQLNKFQHFTTPPPRYTESSLIKQLDALGIGRPSTYALIVSTIINRTYVILEERKLIPTELGETVNRLLIKYFPDIFNVVFTADMETELDKIASGELSYKDVLDDFYKPFSEDLETLNTKTKEIKESLVEETDSVCDLCGKPMVIKWGRNGRFLSCTGYPKCKNAKPLPHEQDHHDELAEGKICQKCGAPMVVKTSRFGKFLGCSRYPKCDFVMPITLGIKCPKCKEGEIMEKKAQKSKKKFYGCTRYPECDFIVNFKPVDEKCEACGNEYMLEKSSKKEGKYLECPSCKSKKSIEEEIENLIS